MSIAFSFKPGKSRRPRGETVPLDNGFTLKGDNGCAIILIHGLTGTPNEMKFPATFLNKNGYTVICPRLANHGEPLEVLKDTKWQEFYQSARQAYMETSVRYDTIFAAGLSMGALLALLLADEFKDKIAGVSCLSPTLFYDGWNTPWYRCFLPLVYRTPLKHFFYFKEEPPYGLKNEGLRSFVHKYYSNATLETMDGVAQYGYPFFPVSLLYELDRLVQYVSRRLKSIQTPVQLIQAQEDDMTSVKNSQFIFERIGSQIKELVLLKDSYHVIIADLERDKVAQKMDEFFRKLCRTEIKC